ncbi:PP2C family protein-serine/threonine phosphatase [Actinomadura roseirufa]|uniref:PP2C family protein-serine/threonine phosphatase n=1 Tax=Actinomadura roseirufa TaxID=2094049 RepID=UPI001F5EB024|nr:PP2C family protein-serine/threonine phosphatase [Actinomadura roseirufa]
MERGEAMLGGLLAAGHRMSLEELPDAVAEHAAAAGLRDALIYVVDIQQNVLRLLTGHGRDAAQGPGREAGELRVDATLAGRAYQSMETVVGQPAEEDAGTQIWVPMLHGSQRIGVLRAGVERGDAGAVELAGLLAGLVALLIYSKGSSSDSYLRLIRVQDMTVSAEMQWRLMPPLTFASDRVVIGAALEPAYRLGGDAFDYGVTGDIVHLAVFDAMGHDTSSGLTANLAVATCRNVRLEGRGLVETGEAIEAVLVEQFESARYVTAVLAEFDVRTGRLAWLSHGHPAPVVIRNGRWATTLECPPGHPLGTDLGVTATVCEEQLEPGDRLLLYTDGIVEARDPAKQEFGFHRFVDFVIRRCADGLGVPETLRRLVNSILEHHAGRLDDDATVLLLEWRGPPPGEEESVRQG